MAEDPENKNPEPEEISVEDLDRMLAEEHPEFSAMVNEVSQEKGLSLSQIIISEADYALTEEKERWEKSGRLGRTLLKVLPFLPKLSLRTKNLKFIFRAFLLSLWIRFKNFAYFLATEGRVQAFLFLKTKANETAEALGKKRKAFGKLSKKLKLAFFGILLATAGTFAFIYQSYTKGVIPVGEELFIPSLEKYASSTEDYDPETEVEPFYDNLRSLKNIIEIPKMVVNLVPSQTSGKNPMGIFEFYLEGEDPEVVVEIKDREVEIRDRMQRTLEEFTFDEASDTEGKKAIVDKLKKEVNLLLSTGKVRTIWFKTIVIKH